MPENKQDSPTRLGSDLARVDAHVIADHEYEELPDLTDEALARAEIRQAGERGDGSPHVLVGLNLPAALVAKWKNTGPGWRARMAARLTLDP